ncbi:MAG: imidazoleglycerol-phosphate dehydratase HisB [Candidatus Natronoplasma sp.]
MRRKTEEVDIGIEFGTEEIEVATGDQVLDHMLKTLFFYMGENVKIDGGWDLRHHLWEDMGILLGEALKRRIDGKDIQRFGNAIMPMDDALVLSSVDVSRVYLNVDLDFQYDEDGFDIVLVQELLNGLVRNLSATIHIKKLNGTGSHHVIEASFKALGVALSQALQPADELKSTKGIL